MNIEELKIKLPEIQPSITFEEGGEFLNLNIDAKEFKDFAQMIFNNDNLSFNYLFCLTCVDWKTHLTMVYHFESTKHRHIIVIKSKLDRENPEIETVSDIWRTAELHEREVYDLFGVRFINHPDLRRLFLTEDWNGYPLRKDYEDPVNMIKL
ncbi:MAG: NADH-quinone oxidoreductase subunit C [Fimbriimonadaceae bacterium]|nr:NADH-quinone oxidoreductase subunit C [Chitinophagales bacterium]